MPFVATMFGAPLVAILVPKLGRKTLLLYGMILLTISDVIIGSAVYEADIIVFCVMVVIGGLLRGFAEALTV
jgi:predicted MFS family arabinose efflux permease